ncbi:porin family protein [uncultured Cocleimonas sp.]|uniref:porin family protein n=1 Tax=uncultured Cocleimonas sp. TaxID=1051587 RepID=UPI0026117AC5|nr:outer membrane beta-barrel protein [uncultured Cocleimonas sp.]
MNKTILSITLPVVLALGISSSANANGFYVAANSLHAEYEDDFDEAGYNVAVGKYIGEGKRVSLELGYTDYGDKTVNQNGIDAEFKASAIQFSAVAYVPLSPRAGLYGRVGAERIKTKASSNTLRAKVEETNPFFGVGGYYNVTENIDVRVEYQRHEQSDEYFDSYNAGVTVETF